MSGSLSPIGAARDQPRLRQEILLEQVRLLFANSTTSLGITLLAATTLAVLQWGIIQHQLIVGWWLYMMLVAAWRRVLARRFKQVAPADTEIGGWRAAFVAGVTLAGIGWGGAGFLLYSPANLTAQVFVIFVLGGMMLGAGSLLASRPEAFIAFLVPTGLIPTIRLLLQGDRVHLAMALLTGAFTFATLITTGRIYRSLELSLNLQFENRDLLEQLRAAHEQTEAANQALELRVRARTAELNGSTEQLRAEVARREQMEEELLRTRNLESLGVLAGGIAHDFNNFLMTIQGNVELAKARLKRGVRIEENLEQIATAYQRAALLSSQLLTFAKGGAPIRRLVCVADLVRESVELALSRLSNQHHSLGCKRSRVCAHRSRSDWSGSPQYPAQCPSGHVGRRNNRGSGGAFGLRG